MVTYLAAVSEELLSTEDLIPIMWEFRRLPYRASNTYEIMATRFRRAAGIDTNCPDSSQTWEALDTYTELSAWLCESANRDHESTPVSELYKGQNIQRKPVNAVLIEDSVLYDRPAEMSDEVCNLTHEALFT